MNENLVLVLAGLAGCLFGTLFFYGLWWTVRKGIACKQPALWLLGSLLLRTGIVLTGFYLISDGRWERLLACLLGFVIARFIVILLAHCRICSLASAKLSGQLRSSGQRDEYPVSPAEEANHAPFSR